MVSDFCRIRDSRRKQRNSFLLVTAKEPERARHRTRGLITGVALCGSAYLAYSFFNSAPNEEEPPPMAVRVQEQAKNATRASASAGSGSRSPSESPTERRTS
jgi:hypothetical protein